MVLRRTTQDREHDKFTTDTAGDTAVRVVGETDVQISGLNIGGRISTVSINDSTWTALPAVPFANRNAISIQNQTATEFKLNYDNTTVGYVGVKVLPSSERYYEITTNVVIYAKSSSGNLDVLVEEIA